MTDNGKDDDGRYQIVRGKRAPSEAPHDVFVSRLFRPEGEFKLNLIREGMSPQRAEQVVRSIPCFVKRGVSLDVARRYKSVFEAAGASAQIVLPNDTMIDRLPLPAPPPSPAALDAWQPLPDELELDDRPIGDLELETDRDRRGESDRLARGSGLTPRPELIEGTEQPAEPPAPDGGNLTLDDPPGEPPSSRYSALGKRVADKPVFTLSLPPPEPEKPWLARNRFKLIFGAIAVLIATYCYGCSQVMQKSVAFRSNIGDLNRRLENQNARGEYVSDADVVFHVRAIGKEHGIDVGERDVMVTSYPLGQKQLAGGGCAMLNGDYELIQKLPQSEIDFLMKAPASCMVPDAIIEVKIRTTARWGFNSRDIELDRYTWVDSYDFTE